MERAGSAKGGATGLSRRILVVDDNVDAAEMMKALLELQGHKVHVAYEGQAALASLAEFTPEIALLDIGLPGMDGYELARRLRETKACAAYLVALTGWGQEEDRRRAGDAGFDAHLTKPADPAEIERLIARVPSR